MTATLPHDRTRLSAVAIPLQRPAPVEPTCRPEPARDPARWSAAVGGLMAGLAVGTVGVAGAVAALTATPAPPAPAATFTVTLAVPGGPLTSFGDGTWRAGTDVAPGTYTTAGAVGPACRHAVHGGVTGADIVGSTVGPEPATVTLARGDTFETSGCATWNRAD